MFNAIYRSKWIAFFVLICFPQTDHHRRGLAKEETFQVGTGRIVLALMKEVFILCKYIGNINNINGLCDVCAGT